MDELKEASEIYSALGELRTNLRKLHEQGRLRMSTDSWNTEWSDAAVAAETALEALDTAVSATTWMETLPER